MTEKKMSTFRFISHYTQGSSWISPSIGWIPQQHGWWAWQGTYPSCPCRKISVVAGSNHSSPPHLNQHGCWVEHWFD